MNPIKKTVTNFVAATGRLHTKEYKPITIEGFFNDLENRGPDNFQSDRLFRKWTKKIRRDMEKDKTWVEKTTNTVLFVQEYISRLQTLFWKENKSIARVIERISRMYWPMDLQNTKVFEDIYMKIRVFGLRKKLYYLQKPIRVTIFIKSCVADYEPGKYAREHWYPIIHLPSEHTFFSTPFGMDDTFGPASATVNLWYKFR